MKRINLILTALAVSLVLTGCSKRSNPSEMIDVLTDGEVKQLEKKGFVFKKDEEHQLVNINGSDDAALFDHGHLIVQDEGGGVLYDGDIPLEQVGVILECPSGRFETLLTLPDGRNTKRRIYTDREKGAFFAVYLSVDAPSTSDVSAESAETEE